MKITCTKPNKINGLKGSRITIKTDKKEIVDQFIVNQYHAIKFCQNNPKGKHGKRFFLAVEIADAMDKNESIRERGLAKLSEAEKIALGVYFDSEAKNSDDVVRLGLKAYKDWPKIFLDENGNHRNANLSKPIKNTEAVDKLNPEG